MNEGMDDASTTPAPRRIDRRWVVGGAVALVVGLVGIGIGAAASGSSDDSVVTGVDAVATTDSTVAHVERTTVPFRVEPDPTVASATNAPRASTTTAS